MVNLKKLINEISAGGQRPFFSLSVACYNLFPLQWFSQEILLILNFFLFYEKIFQRKVKLENWGFFSSSYFLPFQVEWEYNVIMRMRRENDDGNNGVWLKFFTQLNTQNLIFMFE